MRGSSDGKCRALALRGGGSKGAYEVGALKGMLKMMNPIEYQYDVVVGVSVGAVNAALISLYPKGQERQAVADLEDLWSQYLPQDLWKQWPNLGPLEGLYHPSFLDATPFHQEIARKMKGKKFVRKVGL